MTMGSIFGIHQFSDVARSPIKKKKILEEVKEKPKCTCCSNYFNYTDHKPVLLINCGHTVCKKCFTKRKDGVCEQDNCGKAENNHEFDNFEIMKVMGVGNDVELTKTLERVI